MGNGGGSDQLGLVAVLLELVVVDRGCSSHLK